MKHGTKSFILKKYITDPALFSIATKLPSDAILKELSQIKLPVVDTIIQYYWDAYSFPVARGKPPKNLPSFFHHGAATALYEEKTGQRIGDKDHRSKPAIFYHTLLRLLKQIKNEIDNPKTKASKKDLAVLKKHHACLILHRNLCITVLKEYQDPQIIAHIKKHYNIDTLQLSLENIPRESGVLAAEVYPHTPKSHRVPFNQKPTPKKLSPLDEKARLVLHQYSKAKRKLNFDLVEEKNKGIINRQANNRI